MTKARRSSEAKPYVTVRKPKASASSKAKVKAKAKAKAKAEAKPSDSKTAKTTPMQSTATKGISGRAASALIDQRILDLGDWRGETLARMRSLILAADDAVVEELKWMGTPVWSRDGIICTGESYKQVVKLTFAKGAGVADPTKLFNSSLEGNLRRAIDIREGETVDAEAFKALVRSAIALNVASKKKR